VFNPRSWHFFFSLTSYPFFFFHLEIMHWSNWSVLPKNIVMRELEEVPTVCVMTKSRVRTG
jgi:hypothetical protein